MNRTWSLVLAALPVLVLLVVAIAMRAPGGSVEPRSIESTDMAAALVRAPFDDGFFVGSIARGGIDEASGLAASRRRSDLLWVHNDSGSEARLYAVGSDGRDLGAVSVSGASSVDWEDLASFELDGMPRLLIADVGDNSATRESVMLYVVEEPELSGERFNRRATVPVAWALEVVYEDGPLDSEGAAVDVAGDRILLISKRTVPLRLYEVPLRAGTAQVGSSTVATLLAEIANIPEPTAADVEEDPRFGQFRSQATALDVSPDGRELLVVTYKDAYRYVRAEAETWEQAVSRPPELVVLPRMAQTEAGAYADDGRSLWVTTEQRPAPLFRLDRLPIERTAPRDGGVSQP